jgi:hypothetical protein
MRRSDLDAGRMATDVPLMTKNQTILLAGAFAAMFALSPAMSAERGSAERGSARSGGASAETMVPTQGGRTYRRDELQQQPRVIRRNMQADCHRDVRTHRINGQRVTHRHVGDNCAVRVVRQATQPLP